MAVDIETTSFVMLPLEQIVSKLPVRDLSPSGLKRIQESMDKLGFLENYPITVAPLGDGTYLCIDGDHRRVSAKEKGITSVPCLIRYGLSEDEMYRLAIQSNSASGTVVPMTLVSYAEFVWERSKEGKKQEAIAEMLGWKLSSVKNYSALSAIKERSKEAWNVIADTFEKVTTFEGPNDSDTEDAVTKKVTTVTFTEGLLRNILDLTAEQQLELVTELATNKDFSKGKFTTQAKAYQSRNEMHKYAYAQLGDLGETYAAQLHNGVYSGAYDAEWAKSKDEKNKSCFGLRPKLDKFIQAIRDEWERKNSTRLIHGDFYKKIKDIGDNSIDLIVTDPPYNVASDREFTGLKEHAPISQDFGEWDKLTDEQFIALFDIWAKEWKRILRDHGSGYVFTSPKYCSYLWKALEEAGLCVKTVTIWYKPNPGQQIIHTTYKNSVEYILFFTRSNQGGHTFHWGDENEMQNHISIPICAGNERMKDAKGNTLHPTQKPVALLRHFIEISSNGGDTVFDGFMGVGSTGVACKGRDIQRKFIGIEQEKAFFDAAQVRLAE